MISYVHRSTFISGLQKSANSPQTLSFIFEDIILRRVTKGQCYHRPYLGCREFPAQFELYDQEEIPNTCFEEEKDLGYMLYDFDYSNPEEICPMFFRAVLKNGKLDLRNCEVVR